MWLGLRGSWCFCLVYCIFCFSLVFSSYSPKSLCFTCYIGLYLLNSGRFHFVFLLSLFYLENRVCLSHGVQVAGAAWRVVTTIMTGVGDLMQRTGDDLIGRVLGGRAIERSGASYAVCIVHVEMRSVGFLVEPQNHGRRVVSGLASKPPGRILIGLGLKTNGDGL
jgi:uncharacterized membrane protein (GlpM family)